MIGNFQVPPVRVLCAIVNPPDLPRFDDRRVWDEIAESLESYILRGQVILERAGNLTEAGLREVLDTNQFHAVHFVGHAQARAANYGTVALLSSDGRARNLTVPALAKLAGEKASVRLWILQACDDASFCFDAISQAIAECGATVVAAPRLGAGVQRTLLSKIYAGILQGLPAEALAKEIVALTSNEVSSVRVITSRPYDPVLPLSLAVSASAIERPVPEARAVSSPSAPPLWQQQLAHKRATGVFDVFLCHNSGDKPAVKRIGQRLKEAGILPWLDVWELAPGLPWQPLLEQQIENIRSAAVFVGAAGLGPWQEQELYGFLREFVNRKSPVIPVLLPDAPAKPELPVFLRAMTWVDFRAADPDPFTQLLWGITGQRPDD